MIITIDGPAGTGKSTVARRLASELGFHYLDTGAMYRMIALKVGQQKIQASEIEAVRQVAEKANIHFSQGQSLLDGVDVADQLRTPEVTQIASIVAQNPYVRTVLVQLQRQIAHGRHIISEGRDQGTVVFPAADVKFFLTADPQERAKRRMEELVAQGKQVEFETLLREQSERDHRDEARAIAPLIPAQDAIMVETTSMTLEEVLDHLKHIIEQKQAN